MGLDQYLSKRHYVKRWSHEPANKTFTVSVQQGGETYEAIKPERVAYVIEQVCYWRKANAIHKWFVDNVQKGEDDCRTYDVEREQLTELLALCRKALESKHPEKILPTQGGFFFGSTDYDDGYKDDLRHTVETLSAVLSEPDADSGWFEYSASW